MQIVGFGSQSMEFKELTKRDAERSLAIELEKLKKTGNLPELQAQMIDKEFGGFQRLFNKFLAADSGSAIEWERIEKLPNDAVSKKFVKFSRDVNKLSRVFYFRFCLMKPYPNHQTMMKLKPC